MLRSNPSAAAGGCTAVGRARRSSPSGLSFRLQEAPNAVNLGVWGGAPEAVGVRKTCLFRHTKSLIVAEPTQKMPNHP